MNKFLATIAIAFALPLSLLAQVQVRRGDCTPPGDEQSLNRAARVSHRLSSIKTDWQADKTYRQLVLLVSFADVDFKAQNPLEFYSNMFNQEGFNQRQGPGCVADYFREQSGGLFNLQFDVYGPFKLTTKAQPYEKPDVSTRNYGKDQIRAAVQMFLEQYKELDFSVYDWDGNKRMEQVVVVFAGHTGNQLADISFGHVWPNTSSISSIITPDGYTIANYTCSCELWSNGANCGIGTVCHEFIHSIGLPDIYPASNNWTLSVVDEWDLMDGGNFTNFGWCPPNLTSLERSLLGWFTPTVLSEPASITGMRAYSEGGEVYKIHHTENEYLLLENRQWSGWDAGLPGRGLAVFHVNYNASLWNNNRVNDVANTPNFSLLCADNLTFDEWDALLKNRGVVSLSNTYADSKNRLHRKHFSSAAFPWSTDSTETVNDELTNVSIPATKMINKNAEGSKLLSKSITNIKMTDDGLISFDFMGGAPTAIAENKTAAGGVETVFDLNGRRCYSAGGRGLYVRRKADGSVRKMIVRNR